MSLITPLLLTVKQDGTCRSLCDGMAVGDAVSCTGDCYTLEDAEPADQWPPARVFLRSKLSPECNKKWVSWATVHPLSIEREPLLLPRTEVALPLKVDDILVYSGDIDISSVFLGRDVCWSYCASFGC